MGVPFINPVTNVRLCLYASRSTLFKADSGMIMTRTTKHNGHASTIHCVAMDLGHLMCIMSGKATGPHSEQQYSRRWNTL